MPNLNSERTEKSLVVLANATEVIAAVISDISGNDISNSINGTQLTRQAVRSMIQASFKQALDQLPTTNA
jgi:ligand-binding sensor protein